jgi:hypothetical protein
MTVKHNRKFLHSHRNCYEQPITWQNDHHPQHPLWRHSTSYTCNTELDLDFHLQSVAYHPSQYILEHWPAQYTIPSSGNRHPTPPRQTMPTPPTSVSTTAKHYHEQCRSSQRLIRSFVRTSYSMCSLYNITYSHHWMTTGTYALKIHILWP